MREQIYRIVESGLREINEELEYDSLRDINETTSIFGGKEGIDSLSLVRLIVQLEQEIGDSFGRKISLADEKALSPRNSPFRQVGLLVDFILSKLGESDVGSHDHNGHA